MYILQGYYRLYDRQDKVRCKHCRQILIVTEFKSERLKLEAVQWAVVEANKKLAEAEWKASVANNGLKSSSFALYSIQFLQISANGMTVHLQRDQQNVQIKLAQIFDKDEDTEYKFDALQTRILSLSDQRSRQEDALSRMMYLSLSAHDHTKDKLIELCNFAERIINAQHRQQIMQRTVQRAQIDSNARMSYLQDTMKLAVGLQKRDSERLPSFIRL